MRELKFRAWKKGCDRPRYIGSEYDESAWGSNYAIIDNKHIVECYADENYDGGRKEYFEYFEIDCLEQYTGLKDKNGKEIYEGDIVTETYSLNYIQPESPDNIEAIDYWVVKWEEKRAGFAPFCNCDTNGEYLYEVHVPEIVEVEVVGNIHENPEILEEK